MKTNKFPSQYEGNIFAEIIIAIFVTLFTGYVLYGYVS